MRREQKRDIQVSQGAIRFMKRSTMRPEMHSPFIAKVTQVYSERMTCDIKSLDGARMRNIPVLAQGGLVNGEAYGIMCLPAINDYVIVMFGSYGQRHKVILGTILPYLVDSFTKDVVNSSLKAFTKKLFEAGKPLEYRRVFKSGATLQVFEDGGIVVETPDGSYIKMDQANGGITFEDANGNDIRMTAGKVTINENLEVLQ